MFENSHVIFVAGNRTFCAHKEKLLSTSPVLREMYSGCSSEINGYPAICLDDPPENVNHFLRAFLEVGYFDPSPAGTQYSIVAAVLRMSDKYQVNFLKQQALRHFSSAFPMRFATESDIASSISLALELSLSWVLPAAFYFWVTSTPPHSPILRQDSQEEKFVFLDTIVQLFGPATMVLDCIVAPVTVVGCHHPLQCLQQRIQFRRRLDYLRNWNICPWLLSNWSELCVCPACHTMVVDIFTRELRNFWETFPRILDLPEWSTLESTGMKHSSFEASFFEWP
ncbi:hypothetical protein C8R43DRAFT_944803 [Mycena crocata]|nr:hypothetical protein C8R43DRAFT_944803 [Mycena crocata]